MRRPIRRLRRLAAGGAADPRDCHGSGWNRPVFRGRDGRDRLVAALGESARPSEPEVWADRAGLAWCDAPGVAAARVVWLDPTSATEPPPDPRPTPPDPASTILSLGDPCPPLGRSPALDESGIRAPDDWPVSRPGTRWAASPAERSRLRRCSTRPSRPSEGGSPARSRRQTPAKLDALAEFAAGAGHELNNPLAVIVGRAQFSWLASRYPEAMRSLRAIIDPGPAGRPDLARPDVRRPSARASSPALLSPRGRPCCLRDLQAEADARGVRHRGRPASRPPPEGLGRPRPAPPPRRHLHPQRAGGDARPAAGVHRVARRRCRRSAGPSTTTAGGRPPKAAHLFDPFYLRPAGRPRASASACRVPPGSPRRPAARSRWQSTPGQGTSFQLKVPLGHPSHLPMATSPRRGRSGRSPPENRAVPGR